jgi:CHAT domain-containing protein
MHCCVAFLIVLPFSLGSAALSQVSAAGLGTRVNGSVFGRCQQGRCSVHGGSRIGDNLFHRFGDLDTRSGIQEVLIDARGRGNVIVGVTNPKGTFLNAPVTLTKQANLFLLSPGGLWLGRGSQFNKIPNLLLSTGVALDLPGGRFNVINSSRADLSRLGAGPSLRFDAVAAPGGQGLVIGMQGGGSLVIDQALLNLEGGLIIDAPTGSLSLRQAHLRGGSAVRLSGQSFSLQDSSLVVGDPGKWGPIDLHSYQDPSRGSYGSGLIERVRISGNQINVSAGSLRLVNSHLSAPKGWVELQTTNPTGHPSDLALINSKIDLQPALAADAWSPQLIRRLVRDGGEQEIRNPIPHIGLFSQGNLQIERSDLNASSVLSSFTQPNPQGVRAALPERAGLILAESAGKLSLIGSTLSANASHNLAGRIAIEAGKTLLGSPTMGGLEISVSQLSAGGGAGSATILIQAKDGLAVINSDLAVTTDRLPMIEGLKPGDDKQPNFFGGQITLYNHSGSKSLLVSSSTISSSHHTLGGHLESPMLSPTVDSTGYGTFGTDIGWSRDPDSIYNGGYIRLLSKGGIRIDRGSLLDASSFDPRSGRMDATAGTIEVVNSDTGAIEINSSRLESRNYAAQDPFGTTMKGGGLAIINDNAVYLRNVLVDLGSIDARDAGNVRAQSWLYLHAGESLRIDGRSVLASQPSGTSGIILRDNQTAFDQSTTETLSRTLGSESRLYGTVTIGREKIDAGVFFGQFKQEFLDWSLLFLEQAYAGSATAGSAWPLRPVAPPTNSMPPQTLQLQPITTLQSIDLAEPTESDVGEMLLEGQQRSLADSVSSLGLAPGSGRVRSVTELQQRLQRIQSLSNVNQTAAKSAQSISPSLTTYKPAIVQLGLAELPDGQVQIKTILLFATGQPVSFTQTIPAEQLKSTIRGFQRQLSRQELMNPTAGPAQELSRLLLQPLEVSLRSSGANALLLAADRGLQAIPYGALPFGGQALAERYALSISPSLGLLDLDAERGSTDGHLLAAGASRFQQPLEPLPMVSRELTALAGEQGASLLIDEAFTEEALQRLAQQDHFRRLHIATHAEFKPGQEASAKLFTTADSISLKALRRSLQSRPQDRAMDLITLSACHTALGDEESELGFVGMALQAGSRSAIGTLWEVDDSATAAFFIQFYRYLRSGLEKDQALQATARAFRNGSVRLEGDGLVGPRVTADGDAILVRVDSLEERTRLSNGLRHPHYWAGMILTGSPW